MGLLEFFGFGKKKQEEIPSLTDLKLSDLDVRYMVDYDMKTWEVTARHYYDWGAGDLSYEWQLKSHDDTLYLEKSTDDEDEWSISRKIPMGRLGANIPRHIVENEDPPDEITYEGVLYYLEEWAGGDFYKESQGPAHKMLAWDYEDDTGEKYLSIEQWGEEDFEASAGQPVEEYEFTNILPREPERV